MTANEEILYQVSNTEEILEWLKGYKEDLNGNISMLHESLISFLHQYDTHPHIVKPEAKFLDGKKGISFLQNKILHAEKDVHVFSNVELIKKVFKAMD